MDSRPAFAAGAALPAQRAPPKVGRCARAPWRSMVSRRGLLQAAAAAVPAALFAQRAGARPEGVRRPDLLPDAFTPVIDLERFLSAGDERRLCAQLEKLEQKTGFKVRVLTQRYPVTPGLAVKDFWGVDDDTVVIVADYFAGGGSLLHFSVGAGVDVLLPPRFWSLLASQYGNKFYVQKNGEDGAILASIEAVRNCLLSNGCLVPPKEAATILGPS